VRAAVALLLICAALAVVAPFFVRGTACGHDLTFHMNSWMEVAQQWREGVLYPRWAAYANYGSGEPRFLFYPPLSWMLGAALGTLLPWTWVPGAFAALAVVLAGLAMHRLAREWLAEPYATLAALAYALNPYLLLTIYVRSAFAELLATAFLPLLVLWLVRECPPARMLVPLAVTTAALWLTNIPAAIIASYTAALLLVAMSWWRRDFRMLWWGGGAMALSLALAAFFVVPVLGEKGWITTAQALSSGVRPQENFLFTRIGEPEHDEFLRTLSWLAVAELAVSGIALLATWKRRSLDPVLRRPLALLWSATLILVLPLSAAAYRWLPELQFVQFPWRWMMFAAIPYAVFVATALNIPRGKIWLYGLAFVTLIAICNWRLQPRCDPEDTPQAVAAVYHSGEGYMGTDEYTPAGADNYEVKPQFPEVVLRSSDGNPVPSARVTHLHGSTYRKQITVESPQPVQMVLRLMNYPAWEVTVNGAPVMPASDDPTGRMVIPLTAGHSQVDVRFTRTPDRWLGDCISLAAAALLYGFWYFQRRRSS